MRPVIKEYCTQGFLLRRNEEISQRTGFWTGRGQEKAPELTDGAFDVPFTRSLTRTGRVSLGQAVYCRVRRALEVPGEGRHGSEG